MSNRQEHTNTFKATSDEGDTYTIFEFTTFDEIHCSSGDSEVPVLKVYRTKKGHTVIRREKGVYEIVELGGFVVRSNDPNAP